MEQCLATGDQHFDKHYQRAYGVLDPEYAESGNAALQLKMDELLRAVRNAQNSFIDLKRLSAEELQRLKGRYAAIAQRAREEVEIAKVHDDVADVRKNGLRHGRM